MSRIITVTSGKGGVGKSSISVNLAIALAHQNLKVCLIDGDFGLKNLDVMMGLENRVVYDLNDVISGKCEIHQVLVKDKREQTLYLLPACKTLSFQNLDASIMAALIDYLKNDFDFIIVDSPAGIEQGFTYASSIADEAIIVVNLDLATLRDNDRVIGLLLKKGIQDLKLIINKVNLDDIEDGKSLTIDDALDILSLPANTIPFGIIENAITTIKNKLTALFIYAPLTYND